MNWSPEPHWQWWRTMIPDPEPVPDPKMMAALQQEAKELYRRCRERSVNMRHSGIKVTLGGSDR